eukprot:TRINITY_DN15030_c0_g1_i1.p1 TRINITY_DN15030_c0_g1~~TRINITY_DN15030_c0_g1_i1.p1  ORF type:complete len:282 (-),score=20.64 TRINITY_DN15030_c0_g1_i1:32-877(-)
MGICKCRKRTDLFCFVHRKAVCQNCLCSEGHKLCYIKTYSEWLNDSQFTTLSCGVCSGELTDPETSVRLPCLDAFHTKCLLSHFASELASENRSCITCKHAIIPENSEENGLFADMRQQLGASLVPALPSPAALPSSPVRIAGLPLDSTTSGRSASPSTPTKLTQQPTAAVAATVSTPTSRSQKQASSGATAVRIDYDDADNKYQRKKSIFDSCTGKGNEKPSTKRRVLIVLVIILACFIILALLSSLETDTLSSVNVHNEFKGRKTGGEDAAQAADSNQS